MLLLLLLHDNGGVTRRFIACVRSGYLLQMGNIQSVSVSQIGRCKPWTEPICFGVWNPNRIQHA
jgi:hypothetical protein